MLVFMHRDRARDLDDAVRRSIFEADTIEILPDERMTDDLPLMAEIARAESITEDLDETRTEKVHPLHKNIPLLRELKAALNAGRRFYDERSRQLETTTEIIDAIIRHGTLYARSRKDKLFQPDPS